MGDFSNTPNNRLLEILDKKGSCSPIPSEQLPFHSPHIQNSLQQLPLAYFSSASLQLLSQSPELCCELVCCSCDNCFRISCDVDILILGDFKVFHTKRITNLHTSDINLDLVNQICRKCFVCNLFNSSCAECIGHNFLFISRMIQQWNELSHCLPVPGNQLPLLYVKWIIINF